MNSKRIMCLLFLTLFVNLLTFSQSTDSKDAKEFKSRILIVELKEEDPKVIKKLSKDADKLKFYRNNIKAANTSITLAAETFWTFNDSVMFLPETKAAELAKSDAKKYASLKLVQFVDYETYYNRGSIADRHGLSYDNFNRPRYGQEVRYSVAANEILQMEFRMPNLAARINLPNLFLSYEDAVYGLQQAQYLFNYIASHDDYTLNKYYSKAIKEAGPDLKNKTLLIDKNDLGKEMTEAKFKAIYPYPFTITDPETIADAIIEKDPKYAFIKIISIPGTKGNMSMVTASSAQDGKIFVLSYPKVGVGIKGSHMVTYNERIKEKQVKNLVEAVQGK